MGVRIAERHVRIFILHTSCFLHVNWQRTNFFSPWVIIVLRKHTYPISIFLLQILNFSTEMWWYVLPNCFRQLLFLTFDETYEVFCELRSLEDWKSFHSGFQINSKCALLVKLLKESIIDLAVLKQVLKFNWNDWILDWTNICLFIFTKWSM